MLDTIVESNEDTCEPEDIHNLTMPWWVVDRRLHETWKTIPTITVCIGRSNLMKRLQLSFIAHWWKLSGTRNFLVCHTSNCDRQEWLRLSPNFHQWAKSCKRFIRSDLPMRTEDTYYYFQRIGTHVLVCYKLY